jgi:hypothetical protein
VISPSQGRYLHRTTQTQNKRIQTSMHLAGFEPTIPVLKRAKIFHALDRATTVTGTKTCLHIPNWIKSHNNYRQYVWNPICVSVLISSVIQLNDSTNVIGYYEIHVLCPVQFLHKSYRFRDNETRNVTLYSPFVNCIFNNQWWSSERTRRLSKFLKDRTLKLSLWLRKTYGRVDV